MRSLKEGTGQDFWWNPLSPVMSMLFRSASVLQGAIPNNGGVVSGATPDASSLQPSYVKDNYECVTRLGSRAFRHETGPPDVKYTAQVD